MTEATQQGVQLGIGVEYGTGPDGQDWVGVTLGMGTTTYTLSMPATHFDDFIKGLKDAKADAFKRRLTRGVNISPLGR